MYCSRVLLQCNLDYNLFVNCILINTTFKYIIKRFFIDAFCKNRVTNTKKKLLLIEIKTHFNLF